MKKISTVKILIALFSLIILLESCIIQAPEILESETVPEIDKTREVKILTAFFGLDNALPRKANLIYNNAYGKDGMPLVFSHELDPSTIDGTDFEVTAKDGTVHIVAVASLQPANEEFELRTVLLIGEYGNYPDNPPMTVRIVGDLMSRTGVNYKGQTVKVIPLEKGPVLSYAEYFTFTDDYPYVEKGAGCDCPQAETKMVVKAVWSGGVRAVTGKELGDDELDKFTIKLLQNGDTISVHPFQLADLDDNDNNIDLCIKEKGTPFFLEVKDNTAIDPRDDKNPKTQIKVISRW